MVSFGPDNRKIRKASAFDVRFRHAALWLQEEARLNDRNSNALDWALGGIAFALMMQYRPFRWMVFVVLGWAAFLMVQDWWSEHELPDNTPALAWGTEGTDASIWSGADNPTYEIRLWFQNRSKEEIQEVQLVGTLYECPSSELPIGDCTPVDRELDALRLDLAPGFRQHRKETLGFHNAGGPNPRVIWAIRHIVADGDAADG